MEENNQATHMSKRKKLILKISVWILAVLVLCTFVSNSIYTMLLPKVEVTKAEMKELSTEYRMQGKISFSNEKVIEAEGEADISEVLVRSGSVVKAGAPLIKIDSTDYAANESRLRLAVAQLENQLTANEPSKSKKAEIQLQLDIAKQEYELFKINSHIEEALADGRYDLEQMQLREKSELTQAQLSAAYAQWQKYWLAGASVDRAEEIKLRKQIVSYERQLKSKTLSDEKRAEIEGKLLDAQSELDDLVSTFPTDYDYILEQQYRASVIQAQNNVLLLDDELSDEEKNSAQLEYELAQEEYKQYLQTEDIQNEISEQKLKLSILQYENMLNPQNVSAEQKAAIQIQLDIAKRELADFQASFSSDGTITAAEDCTIVSVSTENGAQVTAGEELLRYRKAESEPYVKWDASYEAGTDFSVRTEIQITFKKKQDMPYALAQQEMQTVTAQKMIYDEERGIWHFAAKLNEFDGTVQSGTAAEVVMRTTSDIYHAVVPLACLYQSVGGEYTVMRLNKRNGLFSAENYVEEVSVKVLEKNNFYAAIEADSRLLEEEFVKYTSLPLKNGAAVSLT